MTSCLCFVSINYPSSAAITPDAAWHSQREESRIRTLIKGKCDWNGVIIPCLARLCLSPLSIPLHQFHLKSKLGSQTWIFKGNGCNQTIDVVMTATVLVAKCDKKKKGGEKNSIMSFREIR